MKNVSRFTFHVSHKIVGVIPARYGSKRLPGKPLIPINGKPMIQRVWERASKSKFIDLVIVATDSKKIFDAVKGFGGEAVMTSRHHKSGTDRIYEAVRKINCNIVVNIQGDEPFIDPGDIDKAIKTFFIDKHVNASTLCHHITRKSEIKDPNIVKVILDKDNFAVYFSRLPIPFKRDTKEKVKYYKHLGLYVFRKDFLLRFIKMKPSGLERAEKLEQLRILENCEKIKVVETINDSLSIDTFDDLKQLKKIKIPE
jgi:3-deoxy-manno-octulosonate cytidylyltransferase (CMP-KDO synthetase)